jgi:hypothetical protein
MIQLEQLCYRDFSAKLASIKNLRIINIKITDDGCVLGTKQISIALKLLETLSTPTDVYDKLLNAPIISLVYEIK